MKLIGVSCIRASATTRLAFVFRKGSQCTFVLLRCRLPENVIIASARIQDPGDHEQAIG